MEEKKRKINVVAIDMGYGHQRAAYPFLSNSNGGILNFNKYQGITRKEKNIWRRNRKWYERISRFKKVPIIGNVVFGIMDYIQRIEPFYPHRDLSKNSLQQKTFYSQVKSGLGKELMKELNKTKLPLLTTFFVSAYATDYYGYNNKVYCIVCDADIARAWAPVYPKKSKINYLVPNKRVKERLKLYGVKEKNILITGFPLPKENIGGLNRSILTKDLATRISHLDPRGIYVKKYGKIIENYLCSLKKLNKNNRILTITFAVGGAGAQREIGEIIIRRLKKFIKKDKIKINLIAGIRNDVYLFFQNAVIKNGLNNTKNINILYKEDKLSYFKEFNKILRTTDILWTKPSELTFYAGLGLPIIMSEPIGYQEKYNREWLLEIGAGIDSRNPEYIDEWLFDWLDSGWLAEAAMQGFLDAPKMGTYHIENIILNNKISEIEDIHLL